VQYLTNLNFFTPLPIYFQFNLNTNTERVNSLNVQGVNVQDVNVRIVLGIDILGNAHVLANVNVQDVNV